MNKFTYHTEQVIQTEIGRVLYAKMCEEKALYAMNKPVFNSYEDESRFYNWLGGLAKEAVAWV